MRLNGAGAPTERTDGRQLQRFLFLCVRASRIIALSRFSRRLRRRLISRCRSEAIVDSYISCRSRIARASGQHPTPAPFLIPRIIGPVARGRQYRLFDKSAWAPQSNRHP